MHLLHVWRRLVLVESSTILLSSRLLLSRKRRKLHDGLVSLMTVSILVAIAHSSLTDDLFNPIPDTWMWSWVLMLFDATLLGSRLLVRRIR
jgi:hypothetical protein